MLLKSILLSFFFFFLSYRNQLILAFLKKSKCYEDTLWNLGAGA